MARSKVSHYRIPEKAQEQLDKKKLPPPKKKKKIRPTRRTRYV